MDKETKICQNCENQFVIEPDDFGFYEKIKVPPPTWCPECRTIRRFSFRNEHNLYRNKDERTGEQVFSWIPPGAPVKLYDLEYWNSDNWEATEYGRDYDFSRPFFEQFKELMQIVPWPSRSVIRLVNSDYSSNAADLKNCYLCFNTGYSENSAYVVGGWKVNNSFDLYEARNTELSYENYMVDDSYRVFFSNNIEESTDIWFSKDLIGCQNCFGCVNLRGKTYHIFNEPYSKEAYQNFMAKLDLGSYKTKEEFIEKAREMFLKYPVRFTLAIRTVNSTGEHIEMSKNLKFCYCVHESENLAYSQFVEPPASDSYDYTSWGEGASLMYESLECGQECFGLKFSANCWPGCRDLEYSIFCRSSENLFGCVGLKKKQYCILNKQYTKEEYENLVARIKKQMDEMPYSDSKGRIYKYGEFYPPEFSPFGYNETIAQDFFTLSEAEAKSKGFLWRDTNGKEYQTTIEAANLPDNIKDVDESILKEIIKCGSCGRAYRIIQMELDFYKRIGIPLPRLCHTCRFNERFKWVNPPQWRHAKCQCAGAASDPQPETGNVYKNAVPHFHGTGHCPEEFETSYRPHRQEILYCEQCYKTEVY